MTQYSLPTRELGGVKEAFKVLIQVFVSSGKDVAT